MNLKSFQHKDWTKIYEGGWGFLTSSHFSRQYTQVVRFGKYFFKSQSIIIVARGRSAGYMRQEDRDKLGKLFVTTMILKE